MSLSFNDYSIVRQLQELYPNSFRIVNGDVIFENEDEAKSVSADKYNILILFKTGVFYWMDINGEIKGSRGATGTTEFNTVEEAMEVFSQKMPPIEDFSDKYIYVVKNHNPNDKLYQFDPRIGNFAKYDKSEDGWNKSRSVEKKEEYKIIKVLNSKEYQVLKDDKGTVQWANYNYFAMLFNSFEEANSYFMKEVLPNLEKDFFYKYRIAIMCNGKIFDWFDAKKGSFSKTNPLKNDIRVINDLWKKLQNEQVKQRFEVWLKRNFRKNPKKQEVN